MSNIGFAKKRWLLSGVFLILLVISLFIRKEIANKQTASTRDSTENISVEINLKKEYGLVVDSFHVIKKKILPNETLSTILSKLKIDAKAIYLLIENSKKIFDVKQIKSGNIYKIFYPLSDNDSPKYFVYEINFENYVVFELFDSLNVSKGQKEVFIKIKVMEGTISSSLYKTMQDANSPLQLIAELSDVYAWTIDFFRIQKGDSFKVVYEEKLIEGKPFGIGKILTAKFNNNKEDYYAFYFEQNNKGEYFDEKGNSLRKALLKAPLNYSRISSRFTNKRFHPVQRIFKAHLGTDYAAPTGTPILAVGDGTVIEAGYRVNNGNWVKIKHNSTYTTGYLHMSKIAKGVKSGVKVKQGQIIGYVGSTGLATGPHLCYRFWKNNHQVDPLREKIPSAEPIHKEYFAQYILQRDSMLGKYY